MPHGRLHGFSPRALQVCFAVFALLGLAVAALLAARRRAVCFHQRSPLSPAGKCALDAGRELDRGTRAASSRSRSFQTEARPTRACATTPRARATPSTSRLTRPSSPSPRRRRESRSISRRSVRARARGSWQASGRPARSTTWSAPSSTATFRPTASSLTATSGPESTSSSAAREERSSTSFASRPALT